MCESLWFDMLVYRIIVMVLMMALDVLMVLMMANAS
jgi:hypothetical protein